MVARGGAVKSMLASIESVKGKAGFQQTTNQAVQLIEHLSGVEKNVEVVVREGGVKTLTAVLKSSTSGSQDSDEAMATAARALGTCMQKYMQKP